jgi:hypothetical protein
LNLEINKCKRTHDEFADRIIDMVGEANKASIDVGLGLEEFKEY